jgi:two-component system, cell cycle sensor histidine kinase and response regulator CckA
MPQGTPASALGALALIALDESPEAYLFTRPDGSIVYANPAACKVTGYSREDMLSMRIHDLGPHLAHGPWHDRWTGVLEQGSTQFELADSSREGQMMPVELTVRRVVQDGDEYHLTVLHDSSHRRPVDRRLRELVDSADDIIILQDLSGRYLYHNNIAHHSIQSTDVVGLLPEDLHTPETAAEIMAHIKRVLETGLTVTYEAPIERHDRTRWFSCHLYPLRDKDGSLIAIGTLARDITAQRAAARALRDAEATLRAVISSSPVAVIALDDRENVKMWNPAAERIFGWTAEEILDQPYPLCPPSYQEESDRLSAEWHAGRSAIRFETQRRHKDGRILDVSLSSAPMYDENGNVTGDMGLMEDITERRRAEEALRASEQRFRSLAEESSDWIWEMDAAGRFTYCNPRAGEITGYRPEEMLGKTADFVMSEGDPAVEHHRAIASGGGVRQQEIALRHRDGRHIILEISGVPFTGRDGELLGFRGVARDITSRRVQEEQRRRLEAQVQEAQKLESLGVLAGGIAHDFNNLLVGILGNADLALMDLHPDSPARESVCEIRSAAERAADLTKQMLAYSGKGRFVIEPVDVNAVVREMTHLLDSSISKKAHLHLNLAPDLPCIEADVTQIRQVIMNLITNASEALAGQAGHISVHTRIVDCTRAFLDRTSPDAVLPEGAYVSLEVADTGTGMDAETRARMFDPFFSTKFAGRGLGLAATLGIIRGHRGAIEVNSSPGEYTRVTLFFPPLAGIAQPPEQPRPSLWTGRGRVLLVDDEPTVRRLGRRMLERAGFDVVLAADGREALETFRARPDGFACVLLDLTMPTLGGRETFVALRAVRPDVRVIISSGYDQDEVMREFEGQTRVGFLPKPYVFDRLKEALSRSLGE